MLYCIQQWLKLILDLVVMAMAVIIVATATGLKDHISPGAAGVALTLVLLFNDNLTITIQFWTLTEISIGAVGRIKRFAEDTRVIPLLLATNGHCKELYVLRM